MVATAKRKGGKSVGKKGAPASDAPVEQRKRMGQKTADASLPKVKKGEEGKRKGKALH